MFWSIVEETSGISSADFGVNSVRSGLPTKSPTVPPCISANAGFSETIVPVLASVTVIPRLVRLKQISHWRRSTSLSIMSRMSCFSAITSRSSPSSSRTAWATASQSR